MSFQKDCLELFGTKDLYAVLSLEKNESAAKIKKAYYQQSILWHPDRYSSAQYDENTRELAKRKFQVIGKTYSILSDKEKRALYDETGIPGDDDEPENTKDWATVWRGTFKKATVEEMEAYLEKFRGSQEEMDDVKREYLKHKGNMDRILSCVVGAEVMHEDRIREIIRHFIERGEVPAYERFVNEPASARARRLREARKEAVHAKRELKRMQAESSSTVGDGGGDESDLKAMILAKQRKRGDQHDDFLAHLANKYGGGDVGRKQSATKKARKGGAK